MTTKLTRRAVLAGVPAPEPIRALFDQSVVFNDEASAVSLEAEAASDPATAKALGEKSERIGSQALACEGAIFESPARTIDELIVKTRLAYRLCMEQEFRSDEFDVAQRPDRSRVGRLDDQSTIWSILQDLELLPRSRRGGRTDLGLMRPATRRETPPPCVPAARCRTR